MNSFVRLELGGETVLCSAERGLIWPRENLLFVADVHLGKDAAFRSGARWIPRGVAETDLGRLEALLASHECKKLIVLGDFFHSVHAEEEAANLKAFVERVHPTGVAMVPGNHDIHSHSLARACGVEVLEEGSRHGPWVLRHFPAEVPEKYTLCGHLHPMAQLRGTARQSLRVPCFVVGETQCIFPAFGTFTGGMNVKLRKGERAVVVAEGVARLVG